MKETAHRKSLTLKKLDESGQVIVNEINKLLGRRRVKVKNNLHKLKKNKLLIGSHNKTLKHHYITLNVFEKHRIDLEQKCTIDKKTISPINEDEHLILDPGPTPFALSYSLKTFQKLTISNAIAVINNFSQYRNIKVFMPDGSLKEVSISLIAPIKRNFKLLYGNATILRSLSLIILNLQNICKLKINQANTLNPKTL